MRVRKTDQERLEEYRRQRKQLDARMAKLAAKQKSQARKQDARRKIIVGAAALAHAEVDPGFRDALRAALRAGVTREIDREVVQDLIAEPKPEPSQTGAYEPLPALRLR